MEELGAVISDSELGGGRSKGIGKFYRVVAQAVLLFGAETWVLTPRMERDLDSFQYKVVRSITVKQPWRRADGIWE